MARAAMALAPSAADAPRYALIRSPQPSQPRFAGAFLRPCSAFAHLSGNKFRYTVPFIAWPAITAIAILPQSEEIASLTS